MKISPSLLSADFLHLEDEIRMLDGCADLIHLDVMDGTLVPNISFGLSVVEPVGKIASKPLDAHLMIVHPEKYFERFAKAGVSMLSFHYEAARSARISPRRMLRQVRDLGMKAGIAIDPDVPVKKLFPYLKDADFVVIMSVFAGFGGQKFIYESIDRVAAIKAEIARQGLSCEIEVDGGVSMDNAAALREAGADILVAGSSVFRAADPAGMVSSLRKA